MRALLLILSFAAAVSATAADPTPAADRARRVNVALALAAAAAPAGQAECGQCRTDLPAARADAVRAGVPLVLFVGAGKCDGKAVAAAGAIPVRVPSYDRDGVSPPTASRAVVIAPDRAGGELSIRETLPHDATAGKLVAAVKAAGPGPRAVDWFAGER